MNKTSRSFAAIPRESLRSSTPNGTQHKQQTQRTTPHQSPMNGVILVPVIDVGLLIDVVD
jgi:hypothetical protein